MTRVGGPVTLVARRRRVAVRLLAAGLLALTFLAAGAGAAAAHGRGSDATNFRSRVTGAPDVPGVRWRVLGGDEMLQVTVQGSHEVVVLGHEGEPYLRIGPDGAFENRRSPTVPLHRERYRTQIPAHHADGGDGEPVIYDADAPPEWVRVHGEPRWAWHDHRIHWMSPRGPDVEGETVLIPRWEVPVRIDGRAGVVTGDLTWVPPPPWWPWVLAGLVLTLPAVAGLRRRPPSGGDPEHPPAWPAALRPAVVVLGGLALLNLVHVAEDLTGWASLQARLFTAAQTLLYLGLAFGGAWRGRRGDYAGVTAMGIGAGALFLGQGLLYLPVLTSSQVGAGAPAWLLRLAVGASLAQLLPIGLVLWRAGRVVQPAPAAGPEGGAQATSGN